MSKWVVGGNFKNIRIVVTDAIPDDTFAMVNMPTVEKVEWAQRDGELYAVAYFRKLKDDDVAIVRNVEPTTQPTSGDSDEGGDTR